MLDTRRPPLLQHLRQHRHVLASLMLGVMLIWLGAALVQCVTSGYVVPSPVGGTIAGMTSHPATSDAMPCAACAAGSESRPLDRSGPVPTTPNIAIAIAIFLVSFLLALHVPKTVSIPPLPLLPKRPLTLKYYALRI